MTSKIGNITHTPEISRRRMLQMTALGLAAPLFLPARGFGAQSASNALRIGCIGTGRRSGKTLIPSCIEQGLDPTINARVVALCDVDSRRVAMTLGRKLEWNPRSERFIDDDAANAMLSVSYRSGWNL